MSKRESEYQATLIKKLKKQYPDAIITKNDSEYIQGIPDLTILNGGKWAMLETKRSKNAPHRPNQDFYVEKANGMSFARFIFPENEKEVLHDLEQAFREE